MRTFNIEEKYIKEARALGFNIPAQLEPARDNPTAEQMQQFDTIVCYAAYIAKKVGSVTVIEDPALDSDNDRAKGRVVYNFVGTPSQIEAGRKVFIDTVLGCGLYVGTGDDHDWVALRYRKS